MRRFLCVVIIFLLAGCSLRKKQLRKKEANELCKLWYDSTNKEKAIEVLMDRGYVRAQYKSSLKNGKLRLGMNECEVSVAWGRPDDINRTTATYGTREQWVYEYRESYVYFDEGKVSSIQ